MINLNFQYLLQSIPEEIARSYLKRTYEWTIDAGRTGPMYLFVKFFQKSPSVDLINVSDCYPGCCRLIRNFHGSNLFLTAGNVFDFSRFLSSRNSEQSSFAALIESEFTACDTPVFKIRDQIWQPDQPRVMAVLNITPDSFYDGGTFYQLDDYGKIAEQMIRTGADIIDIGGESSRPGARAISETEELSRILKAVQQIRKRFNIPLSIDTTKPVVAEETLAAGADMINDISGLASGQEMLRIIQKYRASYCLMHTQGNPETMQENPHYFDVIAEIYFYFKTKLELCLNQGLEKSRILLDPGIGFGKTVLDNIDILRLLSAFSNLGCQILIGTSNKSFIGKILDRDPAERTPGTIATQALAWVNGATVFRVHAVQEVKDSLEIARLYSHEFDQSRPENQKFVQQ